MKKLFSEEDVHQYIASKGIDSLIAKTDVFDDLSLWGVEHDEHGDHNFELWRLIKQKVFEKLKRLHYLMMDGQIIGSKLKLPTDATRPMELDFLGRHEDGIFIIELKVDRSAERNAFSELLGYSYYIAEMFALSGPKDITNVLVTPVFAKMSRHAFLYDLLISDRNIILYQPIFSSESIEDLRLELYVPSDEDFRHFSNDLLSHGAMTCVVASFHDIEGWIDSEEMDGHPNDYTVKHLEAVSSYCAQLMESQQLHGFCWTRKRWKEMPVFYENALIVCALNPFLIRNSERSSALTEQLSPEDVAPFFEFAEFGFYGRLLVLAKKALKETLTHNPDTELETPDWTAMTTTGIETVYTHNLGFRPTGVLREAYVSTINSAFKYEEDGGKYCNNSVLKVNETFNWFKAWEFMEVLGFKSSADDGFEDDDIPHGDF